MEDLKNRLKNRRLELNLTQAEVAKQVGVSEGTISRWESGNIANMKRSYIAAYAKVLKLQPSAIMGISEDETEPNSGELSDRDEKDIQRRLKSALGELESTHSALMFDGEPLDDETRELLIASLERTIRQAKILAKEKYTPKKYKGGEDDTGGKF